MVARAADTIVKAAFKQRFEEIKDGIEAGRIKFYNPPEVWTEKLLDKTALTCAIWLIAERSKRN